MPLSLEQKLGISPLPHDPDSDAAGFLLLDFLGIYLFQQFFTILAFSLISAFVLPPSFPELFARLYGEAGGIGVLGLSAGSTRQTMLLGATLLGNITVLVIFFARGRVIYRMSWPELGWQRAPSDVALRWALIFYPLVIAFTWSYNQLLRGLAFPAPKQQVASFLSAEQPVTLRIFALLLILAAAPLAEELLYRGILFPALRRYMGVHAAALLSGLLFGLAHIEMMTVLPLAFLGYLLALAYHQSRSLWLPILLHAGNNFLAYLLLQFTSVLKSAT